MALRTFQFIDGHWVAVDIEDGIVTIIAQSCASGTIRGLMRHSHSSVD